MLLLQEEKEDDIDQFHPHTVTYLTVSLWLSCGRHGLHRMVLFIRLWILYEPRPSAITIRDKIAKHNLAHVVPCPVPVFIFELISCPPHPYCIDFVDICRVYFGHSVPLWTCP